MRWFGNFIINLATWIVVRFVMALIEIWTGYDLGKEIAQMLWDQPTENWVETANWSIALIIALVLLFVWYVLFKRPKKAREAEQDNQDNGVQIGHSNRVLNPIPEMPLFHVVHFIQTRRWQENPPVDIDEDSVHGELIELNRQIAARNLTVWGKPDYRSPEESIDPEVWGRKAIDWERACRGHDDAMYIQTPLEDILAGDHYVQLMTSKSQAETIWSPIRIKAGMSKDGNR